MANRETFIKIIPEDKIKREFISSDEEDMEKCRLCGKGFASGMALRNHARMEHIDSFATGDPSVWTEPKDYIGKEKPIPNRRIKIDENLVKIKTEQVLASLQPTNIMDLASKDISYIILRGDGTIQPPKKKKTEPKLERQEKMSRKEKEVKVISGPFECLEPSMVVHYSGVAGVGGDGEANADGLCHQMFFSCCEYSLHHRDDHTKRRKGNRCQVCEKPLLAGLAETAFCCEVCCEGFDNESEYLGHVASAHVKVKPYQCNICEKRFTQQGGLAQHLRMHTGDRPYHCTYCEKSFTQKSGLDQHLRIHTKVKPYRCVICSKTFCQSVHLKQHMRTHTNVAPFQCGICEKRYKQSSHLNYHLKNHNPANMTEEQKQKYAQLVGLISNQVVEVQIDASDELMNFEGADVVSDEQFVQTWVEEVCES